MWWEESRRCGEATGMALGHTEQDKMASSQPGAGGTKYLVLH